MKMVLASPTVPNSTGHTFTIESCMDIMAGVVKKLDGSENGIAHIGSWWNDDQHVASILSVEMVGPHVVCDVEIVTFDSNMKYKIGVRGTGQIATVPEPPEGYVIRPAVNERVSHVMHFRMVNKHPVFISWANK